MSDREILMLMASIIMAGAFANPDPGIAMTSLDAVSEAKAIMHTVDGEKK